MRTIAADRDVPAKRGILFGAVGFGLGIGVCAALVPRGFEIDDGLCFYQGRVSTLIPVTLAFGSVAVGLWATARSIDRLVTRWWLRSLAVLAGLVGVPHAWSPVASTVHMAVGATLFVSALLLGAGVTMRPRWFGFGSPRARLAGGMSLTLGIVAALGALWWTGTPKGYLTGAQIVFMLAVLTNYWTWLPSEVPGHEKSGHLQHTDEVVGEEMGVRSLCAGEFPGTSVQRLGRTPASWPARVSPSQGRTLVAES